MAKYDVPKLTKPSKVGKRQVLLAASGDLRLSSNQACWAKQKEMEDLLLTSIPVDEESIRQLAVERGAAVRDYLLAQKLPSERLFLGAVRTTAGGGDWKPGAELNLATR